MAASDHSRINQSLCDSSNTQTQHNVDAVSVKFRLNSDEVKLLEKCNQHLLNFIILTGPVNFYDPVLIQENNSFTGEMRRVLEKCGGFINLIRNCKYLNIVDNIVTVKNSLEVSPEVCNEGQTTSLNETESGDSNFTMRFENHSQTKRLDSCVENKELKSEWGTDDVQLEMLLVRKRALQMENKGLRVRICDEDKLKVEVDFWKRKVNSLELGKCRDKPGENVVNIDHLKAESGSKYRWNMEHVNEVKRLLKVLEDAKIMTINLQQQIKELKLQSLPREVDALFLRGEDFSSFSKVNKETYGDTFLETKLLGPILLESDLDQRTRM